MKTALLFGSSGLIGGHLLNILVQNNDSAGTNAGYIRNATSASFADGANPWKHVVATVSDSNNQIELYVDGVKRTLDGTNDGDMSGVTHSNYANANEIYMGAFNDEGTPESFMLGGLRDVRFYDYTLSDEQVKSLYLGRYPPTPRHWWKMIEGTGATATIEDYGTEPDSDGTGVSLAWSTDNFKVNGSARIGTNGSI